MGFLQQTWTLTVKNLLIVFVRHWFATTLRAFLLPVIFVWFLSYAKNLFLPPSQYGIGAPRSLRTFSEGLAAASSSHHTVAFVNNGHTGGAIENVINQLVTAVHDAGKTAIVVSTENELTTYCSSSLLGATGCYGAASFHASPNEGSLGRWSYGLFADGAFGARIYVDQDNNDAEIYLLPFQRGIDSAILSLNGSSLPAVVDEYPYTTITEVNRERKSQQLLMSAIKSYMAIAFLIGIIGVTYQLVGQMALEREQGITQLIEAMMPNKRRWQAQAARIISFHLAFDIIYLPGWLIIGALIGANVFPTSSTALILFFHVIFGLSLSSYSVLFGCFFKKAQLSGITTVIIALIFGLAAQFGVTEHGKSMTVEGLAAVFPPMNYIFFLMYVAGFENANLPVNLLQSTPDVSMFSTRGIIFWIFMVAQIIAFPIIGAITERLLYGTASKGRKLQHGSDKAIAVSIRSFSKIYRPNWFKRFFGCCGQRKRQVVAVKDLNLDILQGQIMVLLGANGSGKSTTLDAVAGLNTMTSGSIEIDGRGGLGLCPQKNVMWDELTVFEHVKIFNRLKKINAKASKADIHELVAGCDLDRKLHARASTLSGGQKRKLQVCMMLTGDSKVCLVDEASSGIDPLARRKIWDILLAERGIRTIILTSHFLDEADVLSDRIAILSKGILKAEGTSVELKNNLGGGYRVHVPSNIDTSQVEGSGNLLQSTYYDETVYHLPGSRETAGFITGLERHDIQNYRVNGPTVQDVFLKLADEVKGEFGQPELRRLRSSENNPNHVTEEEVIPVSTEANAGGLELFQGTGAGIFRQTWVLFRKRIAILRHNYMPHLIALIIPIVAAYLVPRFLINAQPLNCSSSDQTQMSYAQALYTYFLKFTLLGPPGTTSPQLSLAKKGPHLVNTTNQFNSYIEGHFSELPFGVFDSQNPANPPLFAYQADYGLYSPVFAQNVLNNILGQTNIGISVSPFAVPYVPAAGNTLLVVFLFVLAIVVSPALFALYPTAERLRKVRALHYSNGIRSLPLWTAYIFFDLIFILILSGISIELLTYQWNHWYYPGYVFFTFVLFGLTSTVYSYAISLFVSSQLAAFAFSAGSQAVLFLLYFVAYLCIRTYLAANVIDYYTTVAHFTIGLITPSGNLVRAMLLSLNNFSLLCRGHSLETNPGDIMAFGGPILYLIVQFAILFAFVVWYDGGGRIKFFLRTLDRLRDVEVSDEKSPEILDDLTHVDSSNNGLRVLHLTKVFGSNVAVEDVTFGIKKGEIFALLGPNGAGKSTTISLIRGDIQPTGNGDVIVEGNSLSKHRNAARNHLGVCPQFDAIDKLTVIGHLRFYARVRGVPNVEHNVQSVMQGIGLIPYKDRLAEKLSGGNKRKLSLAIAIIGNPSVLLLDEPSSGMDAAAKRVMWRVLGSVTKGRALLITTHSMEEADALAERAGIMSRRMLALGTTEALRKQHGDAYYVHLVHRDAPHTSQEEMERVKEWIRRHIPGSEMEERTFHGQLRFSVPNTRNSVPPSPTKPHDDVEMISNSTHSYKSRESGQHISELFAMLEAHKEELGCLYYSVSPTTLDQVFLNVVNKHNVEEENYAAFHTKKKGIVARLLRR